MIIDVVCGMLAYRLRETSAGTYIEAFRVSEFTGRNLDVLTVVPAHKWGDWSSPDCSSLQVPSKDLIDENEFQRMLAAGGLHPSASIRI